MTVANANGDHGGAGGARAVPVTLGAVLAGGRSSRFGSDKAAARLGSMTLADHATAAIAPFVAAVVRVGGADGISDLPEPGLGPLGGIAAALEHGRRHGFVAVLTIACDMPIVPRELIMRLLERAPAYCGDIPVLGHWRTADAAGLIDRLVAAGDAPGRRSVRNWARATGAVAIPAGLALANVNTPADLAAL